MVTCVYPLLFAQPQSRDESIRCAQLEKPIWQRVTLARKHTAQSWGDDGRARHPCSQEQETFAQS